MHVAVHKGHSASSSPFTCWPYANSRIRDRTRPTAIGIQIQISHCARVPAPVTGFTFSRRSRRNPYTCHPFRSTRIPVLHSNRQRERERERKKREKSEKKHNNNTWARRGLVSGPEATIGKFEIERSACASANRRGASFAEYHGKTVTSSRTRAFSTLPPPSPFFPIASLSLFRPVVSLEITRPWKPSRAMGISMHTCERVSDAHHLSVFHPRRFPHPAAHGRPLIPGIVTFSRARETDMSRGSELCHSLRSTRGGPRG